MTVVDAAREKNMNLANATFAVQGYGNVGGSAAVLMEQTGAKLIAVSDSNGGLYNPKGISAVALREYNKRKGTVVGFKGCDVITNKELLAMKCDVLIPAALENQITVRNARAVRAKMVVEGANGPTTPEADDILNDRGIFLLPDILANAGGVTVSYFEWMQGQQEYFWSEKEVNQRLGEIMHSAFAEVLETSKKQKVSMRLAAYIVGVGRVAAAIRARGIYP